MKILAVEQDAEMMQSVKNQLTKQKHHVTLIRSQELSDAEPESYDLLLLDGTSSIGDWFTPIRQLRSKRSGAAVLMLTPGNSAERIQGLETGADYCLSVPFDAQELSACIRALGRRLANQVDELVFGNTILDLSSCLLFCGENSVRLSAKEFNVMRILMLTGKRNLPKDVILSRVWGSDSTATDNYVEVYVGFLRKKLRQIGSNVRIEAIRWQGYHLEVK